MKNEKQVRAFISLDEDIVFEEYTPESIVNVLRNEKRKKKHRLLKQERKSVTEKYGGKLTVFQPVCLRMAVELQGAEKDTLLVLMGLCEYENFIHVSQADIAKILNKHIPSISKAIKSLERQNYIEISKKHNINFYRILPVIGWKGSWENHKKEIDTYEGALHGIKG